MDDLTRTAIGDLANRVEKLEANEAKLLTAIKMLTSVAKITHENVATLAKVAVELQ